MESYDPADDYDPVSDHVPSNTYYIRSDDGKDRRVGITNKDAAFDIARALLARKHYPGGYLAIVADDEHRFDDARFNCWIVERGDARVYRPVREVPTVAPFIDNAYICSRELRTRLRQLGFVGMIEGV